MIIQIVTVLLALALLGLLVDWPKVVKRLRKPTRKPVLPTVSAVERRSEKKSFDFEPQEETAIETIVPEEEEQALTYAKDVEDLLGQADIHFRKGELKAAEEYYLQAAAKDPRCSKAYSRLGVIYLENGDNWEDAEAAFRQALKTDSQNGFILNNLGLVLYHQDKYADAIRHFEQAVRQDELNAARHANLGMAYLAMRQYAKAESSFKKALKLSPNEMEYKDLLNESIEKKKAHKTMVRR